MAHDEFDPFHLSSGLPLSGATVTVTKVEFGIDNEYADDACVAMITFTNEDSGEEQRQLYSVGKTFEAGDRGDTLISKSGKKVNLNDNSNYGRLVKSFTTMENAKQAMTDLRELDVEPVFHKDWLEGCRFVMTDLTFDSYAGKGEAPKQKTLIVFGEYLGRGEAEAPKSKGKLAPKAGTKATAKAKADDDDDETFGIEDEGVRAQVIKLAKKHAGDFAEYSDKVTDIDEVMADKALRTAALSQKPGSVWATHGAE